MRRPRWKPCHGTERSWTSSGQGSGSGASLSRNADRGDARRAFGAAPSTRSTDPLMNAAAGAGVGVRDLQALLAAARERGRALPAVVVHQPVDPARRVEGCARDPAGGVLVAMIAREGERPAAAVGDLGAHGLEPIRAPAD